MRKTITTLIFCITTILSFGQVKLHNENEGLLCQPCDSSYGYPNTYMCCSLPEPRYDTLPVVMQISDTTNFYGIKHPVIKFNDSMSMTDTYSWVTDSSKSNYNHGIYWINGYDVSEPNNNISLGKPLTYHDLYTHKEYLDENRNRYPKIL